MWINIVDNFSISEIIAYLKTLDKSSTIYLSLNHLESKNKVLPLLEELKKTLAKEGIAILFGPHFVEEGLIIGDDFIATDELYFATPSEKVIWYQNHYPLPEEVKMIVLVIDDLGIEPLIVKRKGLTEKYQYCFVKKSNITNEKPNTLQRISKKTILF